MITRSGLSISNFKRRWRCNQESVLAYVAVIVDVVSINNVADYRSIQYPILKLSNVLLFGLFVKELP